MMTSFFTPVVSGMRRIFSGSLPAMHAAVASMMEPAPPELTIAASTPMSLTDASAPTAFCRSISGTNTPAAEAIA
ncbi:MAG: hypothetical protein R2748_29555 [Bryobacterales bacterium]